ncbi:MAG: hypothetical protein QF570_20880 [Myxococcota bacterium]|jgi:hypothetical protein|nr:hypothetical protein [Myxococcota bacterium]
MIKTLGLALAMALLMNGVAVAESEKKAKAKGPEAQHLSGMSIVGNDEAPKSLAIVPWKGSQLGDTLNAIKALDSGRQPVDRDVFARALAYYELRVGNAPSSAAARKDPQP